MMAAPPSGRAWRDATGGQVTRARLVPGSPLALERQLLPGVTIDHQGWERSGGADLGRGARYAPRELRQALLRLGLDRFLREAWDALGKGAELVLTTTTHTHPGGSRLRDIRYRIDAVRAGERAALLDASVAIEDRRQSPRVSLNVHHRTTRPLWTRLMTSPNSPLGG